MKTLGHLIESLDKEVGDCLGDEKKSHQARLSQFFKENLVLEQFLQMPFEGICLDSRKIEPNNIFVLLKSYSAKKDKQIDVFAYLKAVDEKAVFVLSEIDIDALFKQQDLPTQRLIESYQLKTPLVYLPNIRDILGSLIQYDCQSKQAVDLPFVFAVTGTNGKTTISQLVAQLCQLLGFRSAVMGTVGNGLLNHLTQASHTTADTLAVQQFLYQMGKEQVEVLALEASSHGLHQQRLQGVPIQVAIYSNLSRDHMDYHHDMDEYAFAKSMLFDRSYFPHLTHAIINQDDEYATLMMDKAKNSGLKIWTYSLSSSSADFYALDIVPSLQGTQITLMTPFSQSPFVLHSPLLGQFNVSNLLAAIASVMALCEDNSCKNNISLLKDKLSLLSRVQDVIGDIKGANGRMQRVASASGCFLVDYAHTPDALVQVLSSLKPYCQGDLWVVFGCGGDRDKGKRPMMAQSGLKWADKVVLTSDNPRSENPLAILADMQVGMSCEQHYQTHIEPDRKQAIFYAVKQAKADDVVVIAGKGHETYQEINGVKYDFDDKKVLIQALSHFKK